MWRSDDQACSHCACTSSSHTCRGLCWSPTQRPRWRWWQTLGSGGLQETNGGSVPVRTEGIFRNTSPCWVKSEAQLPQCSHDPRRHQTNLLLPIPTMHGHRLSPKAWATSHRRLSETLKRHAQEGFQQQKTRIFYHYLSVFKGTFLLLLWRP